MCGSLRGCPEFNRHRSPAATPQVGQGTASSSPGFMSAILMPKRYRETTRETVLFGTLLRSASLGWAAPGHPTHVVIPSEPRSPAGPVLARWGREAMDLLFSSALFALFRHSCSGESFAVFASWLVLPGTPVPFSSVFMRRPFLP